MELKEEKKLKYNFKILSSRTVLILCILLFIGLTMPSFINLSFFPIYDYLFSCIKNSHQGILLVASTMLVLMNSIRILPIYMAVFILLELAVEKSVRLWHRIYLIIAVVSIIPLIYHLIDMIYGVKYHFGMPSILVILAMIFYSARETMYITILKKTLYISILLIAIQWLDIMPVLSNFGFGNGEISSDIKSIAAVIDATGVMNFFSLMLFTIFTVNSFMIFGIFYAQNRALIDIDIKRAMRKELEEAKVNSIRIRTSEETQNLVHDLKTPLTTIGMYTELIDMVDDEEVKHGYLQKINSSIYQLNSMISEILSEDERNPISMKVLFDSVLSQISVYDLMEVLVVRMKCPEKIVYVNKIRISRAIINIIKNGLDSMKTMDKMLIEIDVWEENGSVIIQITDHGKGVEKEVLDKVFERGFSTKHSTGIGLEFVKSVVDNHNGQIKIDSQLGIGTIATIMLPCD